MLRKKRPKIKQYILYLRKDKIAELFPSKIDKDNEFLVKSKRIAFIKDEGFIIKSTIKKMNNAELYICVQGSGKTLSQDQIEKIAADRINEIDLCKENESIIRRAFDTSALAAMFETLKIPMFMAIILILLGFLLGVLLDIFWLHKYWMGAK